MSRLTVLGVALGVLLAGAVLGARALVDAPIEVPKFASSAPTPPPLAAPSRVAVMARPKPQAETPAPPPVAPAPAPPPQPAPPAPREADPLPDDEQNPFATETSVELDYAFDLVYGPSSTVETARVAAEVFERCIKQAPENHRCHRGLVAAQQRQQPGWEPPPEPEPIAPLNRSRLHPKRIRQPLQAMPQ